MSATTSPLGLGALLPVALPVSPASAADTDVFGGPEGCLILQEEETRMGS